jgi:hypothetical protein
MSESTAGMVEGESMDCAELHIAKSAQRVEMVVYEE